jgi:chromosome segregation ATPase
MSYLEIGERMKARGRTIWPSFLHNIPGIVAIQTANRAIIFGVYSGAYLHGYNYLIDVTMDEITLMVRRYDMAMSELTAEEQRLVIENVAKTYLENQKLAIMDAKLLNQGRKLEQKIADVDAKDSAISVDMATLAEKQSEYQSALAKAQTRLLEIEARIADQEYDTEQVDAEIIRQQLVAAKANVDALETGVRALEIQAQIAEAGYRLSMIPIQAAEINADISQLAYKVANVTADIAETQASTAQLTAKTAEESTAAEELYAAVAQTNAYRAETATIDQKVTLYTQRVAAAETEVSVIIPALSNAIQKELDADLEAQDAKNTHQVNQYNNSTASHNAKKDASNAITREETAAHVAEAAKIGQNAQLKNDLIEARKEARGNELSGAEEAARIMAEANIVNTLTHQIGVVK